MPVLKILRRPLHLPITHKLPPPPMHQIHQTKDNTHTGQDPEAITRYNTTAVFVRVKEAVCVETLSGMCEVGEGDVEREDEDEEWELEDMWGEGC
jgi:hypothetical protein